MSEIIIIIVIIIIVIFIITTHHGRLRVHCDGWFICNKLQCGMAFDSNSQSVEIVLQGHTHSIKTFSRRNQRVVKAQKPDILFQGPRKNLCLLLV